MIQLPFSFTGTLTYTPYSGANPQNIGVNVSGNFSSKSDDKYELVGAVTKAIDFGSVGAAGAKAILVIYDQGLSPVTLQIGAENLELKAGSSFLYLNTNPTTGITAANLISTVDASLRAFVLG